MSVLVNLCMPRNEQRICACAGMHRTGKLWMCIGVPSMCARCAVAHPEKFDFFYYHMIFRPKSTQAQRGSAPAHLLPSERQRAIDTVRRPGRTQPLKDLIQRPLPPIPVRPSPSPSGHPAGVVRRTAAPCLLPPRRREESPLCSPSSAPCLAGGSPTTTSRRPPVAGRPNSVARRR